MSEQTKQQIIGLDLDGVFVPDCDHIPDLGDLAKFYKLTEFMQPLFIPTARWHLITGRPAWAREYTERWINKHFSLTHIKPESVQHDINPSETPAEYKSRMIIELGVTAFIESDINQVSTIRTLVPATVNVVHFSSFVVSNMLRHL